MRKTGYFSFLMAGALAAIGPAKAQDALEFDTPTVVGGIEAVCTGVGTDAREDARWAAYPLKVELTGAGGVYLGNAKLSAARNGHDVVSLHCAGPWVLLKLAPGAYRVAAEVEGTRMTANAAVPARGQARVVLRFPNIAGAISKEHRPAVY